MFRVCAVLMSVLIAMCEATRETKQEVFDMSTWWAKNLTFDNVDGGRWKQGFPIPVDEAFWTPKTPLNVFVVPHSHVDAGWLKTFHDYHDSETRHIISTVVKTLGSDGKRHFVWADIGFFERWWVKDAQEAEKAEVRRLIANGQLEFVTGAWVTSDEANPRYPEMLEQILEGHRWLQATLGVKPRYGWSIDPFGHSPTMAYLLARVGFDGIIINRVHYEVKKLLAQQKGLEFYWQQRWDDAKPPPGQFFSSPFDASSQVLTHMFPFYSYDVPHTCGPEPQVCCQFDFARKSCPWPGVRITPITPSNLQTQAMLLLDQYRKKSLLFRSRNVLIPVGDDFRYQTPGEANGVFENYQKVFDFINAHPELNANVRFANLSSYFDAVRTNLDSDRSRLPVLKGDFFTYADRDKDYWSGYFSSRPFYKQAGRRAQSSVRAAELLHSLVHARLPKGAADEANHIGTSLREARHTMGIYQHHDAVTGTAKKHVNDDYGRMLHAARHGTRGVMRDSLNLLMGGTAAKPLLELDESELRDANSLPLQLALPLDDGSRGIVIYCPHPQWCDSVVSVPVDAVDARVLDATGEPLERQQLQPNWGDEEDQAGGAYRLFFQARVPPAGYATFFVERDAAGAAARNALVRVTQVGSTAGVPGFPVSGNTLPGSTPLGSVATIDSNGFLTAVAVSGGKGFLRVRELFGVYKTRSTGSNGMYLIDPTMARFAAHDTKPSVVRLVQGPLFDESYVELGGQVPVVRTARAYHHDPRFVDIEQRVALGASHNDMEVVLRYDAVNSMPADDKVFFSDSNGFQMQKRVFNPKLPLAANFYPVTSQAYLHHPGTKQRFSVALAQSHAGASLLPGTLEFVLDRRTSRDDNRGVTQALNDNLPTRGRYRVFAEEVSGDETLSTPLASAVSLDLEHPLQVFYMSPSAPRTATSLASELSIVPTQQLVHGWPREILLETLRINDENTSELMMHVRRQPFAKTGGSLTMDRAGLFSGLEVVQSKRHTLSMLHEDPRYKHGDIVAQRAFDIECITFSSRRGKEVGVDGAVDKPVDEPEAPHAASKLPHAKHKKAKSDRHVEHRPNLEEANRLIEQGRELERQLHESSTPCPTTKPKVDFLQMYVASSLLILQALLVFYANKQSRIKSALMGLVFVATCVWLQFLLFQTVSLVQNPR